MPVKYKQRTIGFIIDKTFVKSVNSEKHLSYKYGNTPGIQSNIDNQDYERIQITCDNGKIFRSSRANFEKNRVSDTLHPKHGQQYFMKPRHWTIIDNSQDKLL